MNDLVSGVQQIGHVTERQPCSHRVDTTGLQHAASMDLYSAVAAHVFASVIHRPHRSAFGRCPSGLWLLRAIARSKLPALATSRLHIRTVSTADPDHSRPRVLTASHVLLLKRDAPSARALAHQHHKAGAERRYPHLCG